jgi:hypothetical protein
LVFAVAWVSRN